MIKLNYICVITFLLFLFTSINAYGYISILLPNNLEVPKSNVFNFCVDKNCVSSFNLVLVGLGETGLPIYDHVDNNILIWYYPKDSNISVQFDEERNSSGIHKSTSDNYFIYGKINFNSILISDSQNKSPKNEFISEFEELIDAGIIKKINKKDLDVLKSSNNPPIYIFYELFRCKLNFLSKIEKIKIGNSNWYYSPNEVIYNSVGCAKLAPRWVE